VTPALPGRENDAMGTVAELTEELHRITDRLDAMAVELRELLPREGHNEAPDYVWSAASRTKVAVRMLRRPASPSSDTEGR
jgi:hypothetical protein